MKRQYIAALSAAGFVGLCAAGISSSADTGKNLPVYVVSEFAPLRKVIVSESEYTDQVLPLSHNYVPLDELEAHNMEIRGDLVYEHADTQNQKKMAGELEALAKLLQRYGVEVERPRKFTQEERRVAVLLEGPTHGKGMTNFFVRDPFIVAGEHVIEANFRKEYRRYEALTAREIFREAKSYVGMPVPDVSDVNAGPFLEGGDVLVYHKRVFVGNSGYGSNSAGIAWLRKYLAQYGYEVEEVRLQGNILHLDCAMSLVREGLMIVCEDSFADGTPQTFRDWDRITVPEKEAVNFAVNGLPVSPDVYITDSAFRETIGKELEARGVTVEYLDFSASRKEMGSIHCSTQPLLRY